MDDILIIGAGVTGCFIARELSRYMTKVVVLDKENDVGNYSSMANSAIVHSGYDPESGSLKALLNVQGNAMYDRVCKELDVTFQRIGSLTVAVFDEQLPLLQELVKRAAINGVEVKLLSADEVKAMEPNVVDTVKGALYAPSAGVIDPFELCVHLMENAMDNGAKLYLNEEVVEIRSFGELYEVRTKKNTYYAKYVINAAGVQADFISQTVAPKTFSIAPRKGEYYVLDYTQTPLVNHVVFPLPSVLGKGILVTPTYGGNYLVGPSSAIIDDKTDLSTDVMTMNEVKKSASQLIKNIPWNKVIRAFSGLRATPSTHDFIIEEAAPNFINVAGIESPGLASSPAIAKKVVEEFIAKKIKLIPNPNFNPLVRPYHRFKETSEEAWHQLISKDKRYARMVCRCETVSEGEIRDLLNRNCAPHSIKGVKKRVRAGFGRCQGGFCAPNVLAILADHYHIKVTEVPYDEPGTNILKQPTKEVGE